MREATFHIIKQIRSKRGLLFFALAVVVGTLFFIGDRAFSDMRRNAEQNVRIANAVYALESADTEALRQKGLGGRLSLCELCGMLFIFDEPGRYAFWMKDMRFPLTLIWLAGETVVFVARDVPPDFSGVIEPPLSADRVIEINAGRATELMAGDQVQFFP